MSMYEGLEKAAYDMLKSFGQTMYLYHKIDLKEDDITGADLSTSLSIEVKGVATTMSSLLSAFGDSNLTKGDKNVIMDSRGGEPNIGDSLIINNVLHNVISVEPSSPGGIPLYYELLVRTYALATSADTLTIQLKNLPEGSIVSDPTETDAQNWRVVAHNHHTAGYTTLVLDQLFNLELMPYNGGGSYPTSPWNATWMYKYLQTTFKNYLTSGMIESLQPITTVTYGTETTDTIFLLSKEELGGEPIALNDGGEAMEYFNLSSKRLASYDGSNTTYWTRDATGVAADGTFTNLNPYYAYGVRPAISLRGTLETALNLEGEYELQF